MRPNDSSKSDNLQVSRRGLLKGTAAIGAGAAFATLGAPYVWGADPIQLGVILPFSGGNELYGQQALQGLTMAVNEANAAGGVLGRQIEIVQADSKTDPKTVVERAQQMVQRDGVIGIVGPVTSASRNAVLPTMERYKTPLLYATDYEGGVCNRYAFCYSALPDHYVDPLLPYLNEHFGTRYYLFGADYIWPKKMNEWITRRVSEMGGEIVGTEYTPWGVKDFSATLRKIQAAQPEVLIETLPGADSLTLIKQFDSFGLKKSVTYGKMDMNENYLLGLTIDQAEGIVGCAHFIETLDKPEARDFVARQKAMAGDDVRVTYLAEAHYGLTKFFIEGIRAADSDDKEKIIDATVDQRLVFGNGEVYLRPEDRHVEFEMLVHQAENGNLVLKQDIGLVRPRNQCSL